MKATEEIKMSFGGKGEILTRYIFILIVAGIFFYVAPLYAESDAKIIPLPATKVNVPKTSSTKIPTISFSALPKIAPVKNEVFKSVAPLSFSPIKISTPKIDNFVPVLTQNTFSKREFKATPNSSDIPRLSAPAAKAVPISTINKNSFPVVPKAEVPISPRNVSLQIPKINLGTAAKIGTAIPTINTPAGKLNNFPPAINTGTGKFIPAPQIKINDLAPKVPVMNNLKKNSARSMQQELNSKKLALLAPKAYFPLQLPKQGPFPASAPSSQRQIPFLPAPLSPISQNTPNQASGNTGNGNSANGHSHGHDSFPGTPLMLGLFGHFPITLKSRRNRMINEISKRLKNGIGLVFGARSPNIFPVNECLLAFVHLAGQEENLSGNVIRSQENCGLFCLYGGKE